MDKGGYPTGRSRLAALLAAVWMACCPAAAQPLRLTARQLSISDGLPSNNVKALIQDEDGLIWTGGTAGLARFDGYRFAPVAPPPEIDGMRHVGLLRNDTAHHLLWITTATYTHACYDLRSARFIDYTTAEEQNRALHKQVITPNGIWLYDEEFGARHVAFGNGKPTTTDYSRQRLGLPDGSIRSVVEDGQKNGWLLTSRGIVRIDTMGAVAFVKKDVDAIAGLATDKHVLVLGSNGDLLTFTTAGKAISRHHLPAALGTASRVTHSFLWQGQWLIFTPEATYCYDLGSGVFSKPADMQISGGQAQGSPKGYQLMADKSGTLWLFPGKGGMLRLDLLPGFLASPDRGRLFNAVADDEGNLWIASFGGGLFVYHPQSGETEHYNAENSRLFASNFLTSIMRDRQGAIWLTTDATGIACLFPPNVPAITYVYPEARQKGTRANRIRHILRDAHGQILLSMENGRSHVFNPATNTVEPSGYQQQRISAIATDPQGHVWIGTDDNGLYIDGQRYSPGDAGHQIPVNEITDVLTGRDGQVWVSTMRGGLLKARHENGRLSYQQLLTGNFNERRINALTLGHDGTVFAGTYNGLYLIDNDGKTSCFNVENGKLPTNEITCLKSLADSTLLVGTTGMGLLVCRFTDGYKKMGYRQLTRQNGLANDLVTAVTLGKDSSIWVGSEEGLTVVYPHQRGVKPLMPGEDLPGNIFSPECALTLADGRLLFGTGNGLAIVGEPGGSPQPPRTGQAKEVVISDITVDGLSVTNSGTLRISPLHAREISLASDQNSLSIYYSNLQYSDIEAQLYQYRMDGIDSDWQPATSLHHADYSPLPPGRYTFHVRTLADGKWSKERTLKITVRQPWWNTWWAWTLYLLAAAAIGYQLYRRWHKEFLRRQAEETKRQINAAMHDSRFKEQLDFLIMQHIGDTQTSINDYAAKLKMGHTKFYTRVKEVTGLSPSRYIMSLKMKTAAELLLDGRLNVSEVASKVGFLDQSYFNKCFKREFNVTPSRYGKE